MNAACFTNILPTALATLNESWPSLSVSCIAAWVFISGAAAPSSAGRKLSLWKEKRASIPPNTTLRSEAGTTVSLLDPTPLSRLTGVEAGLM